MPASEPISIALLVSMLAPTLGLERSAELVADAMRLLAVTSDPLDPAQAASVLGVLESGEGIIAMSARSLAARLGMRARPTSTSSLRAAVPHSSGAPSPPSSLSSSTSSTPAARPRTMGPASASRLRTAAPPAVSETLRPPPSMSVAPPARHPETGFASFPPLSPSMTNPPVAGPGALQELTARLAPTVGAAKSDELVRTAARKLGIVGGDISNSDACAVLEMIAEEPGVAGVAARFVLARMLLEAPRG